jgi:hypothetical protein
LAAKYDFLEHNGEKYWMFGEKCTIPPQVAGYHQKHLAFAGFCLQGLYLPIFVEINR